MSINGIGIYDSDFPIIKSDQDLIIENIKRILTTLPGEDVGNLEFGCRLREYLFNFENILLEDIEQVIVAAISKWEPRVKIISIDVSLDDEVQEKIHVLLDVALLETYERFNEQIEIIF